MLRELNPGEVAPQVNAPSICPWPLWPLQHFAKEIFLQLIFLTQNFPSFFSRRLLVERAPDGLRVDGHQVGGEGDEVVAGGLGREVAGLPVHDVVSVHFAERTEKKTPNDSRLCIFTETTAS